MKNVNKITTTMLAQAFISYCLEWTTAIHFTVAYPMDWWTGCSLSRMLLHVWQLASGTWQHDQWLYHTAAATPIVLAFSSEVGGLQDGHLGVGHGSSLSDCWLSVVARGRSPPAVFCQLKDLCRHSSGRPAATLETDVSWLPDQSCATVFQLVLSKSHQPNVNNVWWWS